MKTLISEFCDQRPVSSEIDTVIIHSMFAPESEDSFSIDSCFKLLNIHGVSAHYVIDRSGNVWNLVPVTERAWHAGESRMPFSDDCRENVNDFSIGIELIASPESGYEDSQYESLICLLREIVKNYNVKYIAGHSDIAPGRKTDPENFDWDRLYKQLSESPMKCLPQFFCINTEK